MTLQEADLGRPSVLLTLPFAQQTDSGGALTLSIKIPGTYSGFSPGPNGRAVMAGTVKFDSPAPGDQINSVQLQDIDGVIPNDGSRAAFATYPVLASFIDPGTAAGVGVPMNQLETVPLLENLGNPKFIPSGLYLVAVFAKGSATQDWVRGKLKVIKHLV